MPRDWWPAAGIPLLGINRGRLGFLTDVMPQDMLQLRGRRAGGSLRSGPPAAARSAAQRPQTERVRSQLALNDVVLAKWETGRILDFETRVDGRFVNTHGGDGLVVASATGSTAYALSCGGPIVDPGLDVLVVVPICPHTLADRPIVVSGRSTITVMLHERYDTRAQVTCDGVVFGELQPARSAGDPRLPRIASRCCIRPATTISGCCAPNCTGAAAARDLQR